MYLQFETNQIFFLEKVFTANQVDSEVPVGAGL